MTRFTKILAASALAFAVVSPALAEEQALLKERNVYLFMNGKMVSTTASEATHAMAMKEFTPIKDGTMIYVSGGKYYIGADKKMPSGKMLHAEIFGKDLGASSQH